MYQANHAESIQITESSYQLATDASLIAFFSIGFSIFLLDCIIFSFHEIWVSVP